MLEPIMHELKTKIIVLASGSPRRQEIIKKIGLNVELYPSLFEENLIFKDFPSPSAFAEETALQKVLEVSKRLASLSKPVDLIIGADTIVVYKDELYGKPNTPTCAYNILSKLVGNSHTVYTGVIIKYGDEIVKFTESATVKFGKVTPKQIQAYVDTGEPLDKAGGYGIQGVGGTMVERIEGDYFTVMGLPLYRLSFELCKLFNYNIN